MFGGQSDSPEKESQRLQAISVPQKFSWTGLKDTQGNNHFATMEEGLVLWNVLGFAVADEEDYRSFRLVNKEWKRMVELLEPPAVFRMNSILSQKHQALVQKLDLSLLSTVLESLSDRHSALYRKDSTTTAALESWPVLQPQFLVIILRFVYAAATQRSPHNYSKEIYDLLCHYLTSRAKSAAKQLVEAVENSSDMSWNLLEQLLSIWNSFEAFVQIADTIGAYISKYYIKHHSLPSFVDISKSTLANSTNDMLLVTKEMQKTDSLVRSLKQLLCNLANKDMSKGLLQSKDHRRLILQASRACEAYLDSLVNIPEGTFVPFQGLEEDYRHTKALLEASLELATKEVKDGNGKTAAKSKMGSNGKGVTIVLSDGTRFTPSERFFQSSGFLRLLHLHPGDHIKLNISQGSSCIEKAIEFCAMEENIPFPIIRPGILPNLDMVSLVGEDYSRFVTELEQRALFEMVAFANFMDIKNLLDLCCLQTSMLMRGKSTEEIRELLAIH